MEKYEKYVEKYVEYVKSFCKYCTSDILCKRHRAVLELLQGQLDDKVVVFSDYRYIVYVKEDYRATPFTYRPHTNDTEVRSSFKFLREANVPVHARVHYCATKFPVIYANNLALAYKHSRVTTLYKVNFNGNGCKKIIEYEKLAEARMMLMTFSHSKGLQVLAYDCGTEPEKLAMLFNEYLEDPITVEPSEDVIVLNYNRYHADLLVSYRDALFYIDYVCSDTLQHLKLTPLYDIIVKKIPDDVLEYVEYGYMKRCIKR